MWVMTLALLIYSATEYLMRKKMEEQRLTVPTPDHKNVLSRPSLMRVYQYLANSNISLTYSPGTEFVRLTGVPLDMKQILLFMGEEWCRYYISDTYRPYIASAFKKMSRKEQEKFIHEIYCSVTTKRLLLYKINLNKRRSDKI